MLIGGACASDVRNNMFANDGGSENTLSCPTQRDGKRILNNALWIAVGSSTQAVRHNRTPGAQSVLFANDVVIDRNGAGYAWPTPVTAEAHMYAGVWPASAPLDGVGAADPHLVAPGKGGSGIDSVRRYTPMIGSPAVSAGWYSQSRERSTTSAAPAQVLLGEV